MDSACVLEIESVGIADGQEREKGESRVLNLIHWVGGDVFH